jgi:AraC-like DNA-binding protein
MDFKITHPKNPIIKEYLKFSYTGFLEDVSYYAYPNAGIPICFFKNADLIFSEEGMLVIPSSKKSIKCIYANNYYKPINIKTQGNIEEFCLVFEPYGLAQFVNKLPSINASMECFEFNDFNDFLCMHSELFSYSGEQKRDALEKYLLSKISEKKHTTFIKDAVHNMTSEKNSQRIYPISQKTFYRAFKNICGVPESVLLKTIQFRKSLEKIKTENPEKTMCQLAYDLGYYDQAHFNKLFKQRSSETPRTFFNEVASFTEANLYFKIR